MAASHFEIRPWDEPTMRASFELNARTIGRLVQPFVDPQAMPSWAYDVYNPKIDEVVHEGYAPEVAEVSPLLLAELGRANAPYTRKATACVLRTWSPSDGGRRFYPGHTDEPLQPGFGNFTTATAMALGGIESQDEKLDGIFLMGKDLRKPKHVMPSPDDYDKLSTRFLEEWGPTITVVSPDVSPDPKKDEYESIWASVHAPAYSVKKPSDFRELVWNDEDVTIIPSMVAEETGLNYEDSWYITSLMFTGLKHGLGIYLIGSASGRGEISNALKPRREAYSDIDLLIVVPPGMTLAQAEAHMIGLAEGHYGPMRREAMTAHDWSTGREIPGIFLFGEQGQKLQFNIGHSMEEINFRPSNLERNYFHRVA